MKINVGIIGCGNIAWRWGNPKDRMIKTHAQGYFRHPEVCLKACVDPDFSRARGLARAYPGVKPYADYKEMLKSEQLDLISVCTSTGAHYDVLKHILEHTDIQHIFAEKPLTTSLEDTKKIYRLALKKNASITINYLRRWDQSINRAKQIALKRDFGQLCLGSIVYYGGFKRNAIHFLDLLNFFEIEIRHALRLAKGQRQRNDFTGSFFLQSKAGCPIYMTGLDNSDYDCLEVELFFERGQIRIGDQSIEIYQAKQSKRFPEFRELSPLQKFSSTLETAVKYGIEYVVDQYKKDAVSHEFLKREINMMRLIKQLEHS